jgi:5-methyltetrahydropteroyltriglutamate--homocysteine methyltransferase
MQNRPLRTNVVGSYPMPAWLELAVAELPRLGPADIAELQDDAVAIAVRDQLLAGLDVITDGEQTRLDFNLSFYGYLQGIALEGQPPRRWGPPAHDQRGRHEVTSPLAAPRGLGVVAEFERLRRIASSTPPGTTLKASVPGAYTLSGRIAPDGKLYKDRWAVAEALLPIVSAELSALLAAGCTEVCVDEPSMSCYAHKEDTARFVDFFNRQVAPVKGRLRLGTHLCFGNYKGRAVGPRVYAPMFPAFLNMHVDEIHVEMASREFAELECVAAIAAAGKDTIVGVIDVKSYYIETPADIAARVRRCLRHAPPDRLGFAPDCGLSQTARWAARQKLRNLCDGVAIVKKELGL